MNAWAAVSKLQREAEGPADGLYDAACPVVLAHPWEVWKTRIIENITVDC